MTRRKIVRHTLILPVTIGERCRVTAPAYSKPRGVEIQDGRVVVLMEEPVEPGADLTWEFMVVPTGYAFELPVNHAYLGHVDHRERHGLLCVYDVTPG